MSAVRGRVGQSLGRRIQIDGEFHTICLEANCFETEIGTIHVDIIAAAIISRARPNEICVPFAIGIFGIHNTSHNSNRTGYFINIHWTPKPHRISKFRYSIAPPVYKNDTRAKGQGQSGQEESKQLQHAEDEIYFFFSRASKNFDNCNV